MNNGTIKNAQITCETGGTVLQATCLNVAQETLQQLLASELTGKRPYPILYKQGDIEQRAIELAEAVGSAFTALDCLPGQLSDLQSRAIRTEELSLKLLLTVTALSDRITRTSLGSDFADTRPVPSDQIGRTHTAVRRAEEYLNSAMSWLSEIDKAIDEPFIIKGGITAAEVAAMMESNRTIGMDGHLNGPLYNFNQQTINGHDYKLKFAIPTADDVHKIYNEVLSEFQHYPLSLTYTSLLVNEVNKRVASKLEMSLTFNPSNTVKPESL